MIRELELINAGPFRGRHVIPLGPGAHAFIATMEDNPARSSGIGKSFIFEMIDYVLTGRLRKERNFDVDGWITRGEKEGKAILRFEDGLTIERWKKIGQSRQLRVRSPHQDEASQDAAQEVIYKHFGFTADEFTRGPYVEQKQASRMVHADPGARASIVAEWLGLSAAEAAEDRASEIAAGIAHVHAHEASGRDALRTNLTELEAEEAKAIPPLPNAADKKRARAKEIDCILEARSAVEQACKTIAYHEDRTKRAKALREEITKAEAAGIEANASKAQSLIEQASVTHGEAARDARVKLKVSQGQFDGQCPVASIHCPATKEINDDRKSAKKASTAAQDTLTKAEAELTKAKQDAKTKLEAQAALTAAQAELRRVSASVKDGAEEAREAKALIASSTDKSIDDEAAEILRRERSSLLQEAGAIDEKIATTIRRRELLLTWRAQLTHRTEEVERLATAQRRAMRAKAILRAAQRRVAERALSTVEALANEMIAESGIDLRVSARWEREGKDPAKQCDECGNAFPKSTKVKICERCGATRGTHTVQRLDFLMSDSSGGLDDLAGAAWQIAAASWLLARRGSPWCTILTDETTAGMDAPMRRDFALMLTRLVSRGIARQLILITHAREVADMLPHRITIVQMKNGERRIDH